MSAISIRSNGRTLAKAGVTSASRDVSKTYEFEI